jgi:hypothetical protein
LDEDVLQELLSAASLCFAPGLLQVLQSATPPTVDYFKSLPTEHSEKQWAIYLLVLEKSGARPTVYIGSGTDAREGVRGRFRQYDSELNIGASVRKALQNGYTIVHRGLICWAPLPSAAQVPQLRTLFLAIEAAFTFVFWAVATKKDWSDLSSMCP